MRRRSLLGDFPSTERSRSHLAAGTGSELSISIGDDHSIGRRSSDAVTALPSSRPRLTVGADRRDYRYLELRTDSR